MRTLSGKGKDYTDARRAPVVGTLGKRTAIVGAAESDIGYTPGKTSLQLIAQATDRALRDAGLTKNDIDGFFSAGWVTMESLMTAEYLGISPRYSDNYRS